MPVVINEFEIVPAPAPKDAAAPPPPAAPLVPEDFERITERQRLRVRRLLAT